jgi:hypothetical protein
MTNEDVAIFQQAERLANSGQTMAAYEMFRGLRDRGNQEIEILFWIATTTPNPVEARQVIDTIKYQQPYHPMLPQLEARHNQKLQMAYAPVAPAPILNCPYCGNRAPAITNTKISTGGWVTFVVLLIVFFPLCWIGFLIREEYRVCSRCGSRIAAAF